MYNKIKNFKPIIEKKFPNDKLSLLFENCERKFIKKHTLLYQTGESADTIYLIEKGAFKLFTLYPDGHTKTFGYHVRGTTIGTLNCLAYSTAICNCEAATDSVVALCPIDLYIQRLRKYDLFEELLRIEARKACWIFDSIEFMFTKDSKEIVATLLDEGMAQHEIADFLGYSTVHISRLCSQLGINRNYNENCK